MINFKRPIWALFLCLLLAACGGGSSNSPTKPNYIGTGNAYFPSAPGTFIAYYECVINGTVDPTTLEAVIRSDQRSCSPSSPNYSGTYSNAYSIQTCALYPGATMFATTWAVGNSPSPSYFDLSQLAGDLTQWDKYTVTSGPNTGATISGIGDGGPDNYGAIYPPELFITSSPVIGQHIRMQSTYYASHGTVQGCEDSSPVPSDGLAQNDWEQNTNSFSDPTGNFPNADVVEASIHEYSWGGASFTSVYERGIGPVVQWWARNSSAPMDTSASRPNYHGPTGNGFLYVMFDEDVSK